MNEWQVFLVIGEIAALLLLVGAPILKLNSTLTKLTTQMETQSEQFKEVNKANSTTHDKMQAHLEEHDEKLADHETRLQLIEKSGE